MPVKARTRQVHKRYGKKRRTKAYQVVVREGSAAPRPLAGMRLFETRRESNEALRLLAHYQDENTRISVRTVRK
jgi:hypothetical protein